MVFLWVVLVILGVILFVDGDMVVVLGCLLDVEGFVVCVVFVVGFFFFEWKILKIDM